MSQRIKTILRIEGVLLLVLAASMIVPFLMAAFREERASMYSFLATAVFCGAVGFAIRKIFAGSGAYLKNRDGFLVVAISWFLASLIGAFPFCLSGSIPDFYGAFFESCSGFTTTGASIITDVEVLPKSILFWRSFTHWLGGMGIIVFLTALLPTFGINGQIAANAETPGPTKDKITAKFSDGAKGLYKIYIAMTLTEILLLKLGGLSWFDSFIHTFGTVGTGGMSSYNASIGHFNSFYVDAVVLVFMLMAAINFNLYFLARRRGFMTIIRDEETRFYLFIIFLAGGLITLCNAISSSFAHMGQTVMDAFFQVISILTTTGYATADYDTWPTFSKIIILCLFFIGGCSSSTGGGIKCVRILVGLKMIRRGISLKIHPNRIANITLNDREIGTGTTIKISNFLFTYVLVLFAGILLLSLNGYDFITNFSGAASCLGNIGPGFNLVGPTLNYSVFSDFSKVVCSFLMITGRLELYTVLVLFTRNYWNPNRVK